MLKNALKLAAVGAFALGAFTVEANAAYPFPATAQTGETVGLARGAPLPEGVYFVDTLSWGVRNNNPDTKLLVNIPVIAWSTPWQLFGGNVQILAAAPHAHLSVSGGLNTYGFYNPFLGAAIAFDLGGGFGVSYLSGFYFNVGERNIRVGATTWRQDFAISYTDNGWNLTANLIWGITFGTSNYAGNETSNGFNLDLTATKTFGKWELGAVGFGSTEYDVPNGRAFGKAKQFAVGPLVGYNFGPVILQTWVTRDFYARNQQVLGFRSRGKETRVWARAIIPLWTPEKPLAPLVTKY